MNDEVKSFIFYTAYRQKFNRLTDAQFGKLVRLMCEYKDTSNVPEIIDTAVAFAFDVVKYDMDTNSQKYEAKVKARREAGAKGGKQKQANVANATFANQNKQKQTNVAYNDNGNDNANVNENVNESDTAPEKLTYGIYNNVRLTNDELQSLIDNYPNDYQAMIDNLSMYLKSKGRFYADHYATMMKWKREDLEKKKTSPSKQPDHGSAEDLSNFYDMVDKWTSTPIQEDT